MTDHLDDRAGGRDKNAAVTPIEPVVRSEEELWITTHRRATHRARLRKRTVTEMVTRTVPLRREEVSLEYEPIGADDDGRPTPGLENTGGRWMVLFEEEVVLTIQRVPTERVRLVTDKIAESRDVSEMLRRERIDVDRGHRSE